MILEIRMLRALAVLVVVLVPSAVRASEPPVSFRTDVIAALSRVGCNSGACHGSPQGKNGFRLSLRGGDPDLDYQTLAKAQSGRRVNVLSPEDSLFVVKGSGHVLHQCAKLTGRVYAAYKTLPRRLAA